MRCVWASLVSFEWEDVEPFSPPQKEIRRNSYTETLNPNGELYPPILVSEACRWLLLGSSVVGSVSLSRERGSAVRRWLLAIDCTIQSQKKCIAASTISLISLIIMYVSITIMFPLVLAAGVAKVSAGVAKGSTKTRLRKGSSVDTRDLKEDKEDVVSCVWM